MMVTYVVFTEGYNGPCVYYSASTEQIDKAKEIIKKLTFNFQSEAFENPCEYTNKECTHIMFIVHVCLRDPLEMYG